MKHVLKKYGWVVLSALVTAAAALPMFSQQQAPARPSFEVASIKPNSSGDNRIMIMNQPGGRFVATGVTLKLLMTSAYRVRDFQIIGGPGGSRPIGGISRLARRRARFPRGRFRRIRTFRA